jgi:transposase
LIFPENVGENLSIDEVDVSNGELYTIITNKKAKGKKGALVAMIHGTKSAEIIPILSKIPQDKRNIVKEITMDMAGCMELISENSFPCATQIIDRFHVQQLVSDAVQEIRINLRREAIKEENENIKQARKDKRIYYPTIFENGDTNKQLLARSMHLLFKPESKWTNQQNERSKILFTKYPEIKKAYNLSMMFRSFYENSKTISEAKEKLDKWHEKVEEKNLDSFTTASESIRLHETNILNYFPLRSTNASAESFNAKLKGFRTVVRGVKDKKFFLFRVSKLYG